jgi:hypothetical protein
VVPIAIFVPCHDLASNLPVLLTCQYIALYNILFFLSVAGQGERHSLLRVPPRSWGNCEARESKGISLARCLTDY